VPYSPRLSSLLDSKNPDGAAFRDLRKFAREEAVEVKLISARIPAQPDSIAMYCFPSIKNEVGGASMPEFVGNSQSNSPVIASKA
jgi:hypothetical protein